MLAGLAGLSCAAGVVVNEFMAAASDRRLSWTAEGAPRLGSGVAWLEPDFIARNWSSGALPAGYTFTGMATSLLGTMRDKAYSVYLRKSFVASAENTGSDQKLVLSIQINDGFVAFLNGRECARFNCGPTNHLMFASQAAYNVNDPTNVLDFVLGPASAWLRPGTNLLAIQAHNADKPSTPSSLQQISSHIPTTEFRINAGLRLAADTNSGVSEVQMIRLGPTGGMWSYWVGRFEPSGGLVDPGLATIPFTPPAGEEDDFEQRADFSDWVELFNPDPAPADISGWSLSDDPTLPAKWRFPTNTVLQPGGFLVVLCDDRDEANAPSGPANYLHTNFKLNDNGESLALYDAAGQFVDGFLTEFPSQVFHCSYGRDPADPSRFAYLAVATPGARNRGSTYASRAPAPRFLNGSGEPFPGGLLTVTNIQLHLASSAPGATIRYTVNGTEPTGSTGTVYTQPITWAQASFWTGLVVRAKSFVPGWLPSETVTHTYVLRQPTPLTTNPALFLTGPPGRTFYAPGGVLAIAGGVFSNSVWFASGPNSYNNPVGNGTAYEREAELEYYFPKGFYPDSQLPLRAGIGLRLSASPWQRPRMQLSQAATASPWPPRDTTQKPSFNLYFRGDYGPSTLNYPFFTNYPVSRFQHLRLRAGKNDNYNPYITDELVRRLFRDLGHSSARGLFASLYVNGVYKGVYNVTERIREAFFQAHLGGTADWDICYSGAWVSGDNGEYQQLLTLLDRNLTDLANWRAVTNRINIENVADYFLLNIYCATWDWPHNNYVLARERTAGPAGRFRMTVWDAEGACNATGYGRAVNYNTITNELIVPSGSSYYNQPLPRIFRRLATSPEFRLFFADRVNRHMFGGGVLDDRDPDGAGPMKPHFRLRQDELVREAGELVRYNSGQAISLAPFTTWAATTTGRRTYLLGSAPGRRILRDSGLWPVTEPPIINKYGGVIAPGFQVSLSSSVAASGQTSTIWYTLDGTDPRLQGGQLSTLARRYETPFSLAGETTVRSRALNDVTGEWSPLTEATFTLPPQPASRENIVVAEMMYNPPALGLRELNLGMTDPNDCEFVRLQNISPAPVHLGGTRFVQGIGFDFNTALSPMLGSGQSLLLVKDRSAFRARYGSDFDKLVTGEFSGNLANGGELISLVDSNGAALRTFSYQDRPPWPVAPDGGGPSLLLREPHSNPDHAAATSWTASAIPGGTPGGTVPVQAYAQWQALFWPPAAMESQYGALADPDGDGIPNFLEYVCALNPHEPSLLPSVLPSIQGEDGQPHFVADVRLAGGASDAVLQWQFLNPAGEWQNWAGMAKEMVTDQPDGAVVVRFVEKDPVPLQDRRLVRLTFTSR